MADGAAERVIVADVLVPASVADVWEAWTTERAIQTFFAPECRVNARPDGPYEVFFDSSAPPEERGGEGNRVMAVQPCSMLSFCHLSDDTGPRVFTQGGPVVFTQVGPLVFGHRGPVVFGQTGPGRW